DESDAERFCRLELALGVLAGMDARGAARAAAAGKIGGRRQRGAGAAVGGCQRAGGTRARIVAADEAKPIKTAGVIDVIAGVGRLSPPCRSKRTSAGFVPVLCRLCSGLKRCVSIGVCYSSAQTAHPLDNRPATLARIARDNSLCRSGCVVSVPSARSI